MKKKCGAKYSAVICVAAIFGAILCLTACSVKGDAGGAKYGGEQNGEARVEMNTAGALELDAGALHQEIDGFGGSDAWKSNPSGAIFDRLVTSLYSQSEGIGFTILRNRIPFRERYADLGADHPEWNDGFMRTDDERRYLYTEKESETSDGNKRFVKTFSLNWNAWDISATRSLIAKIQALSDGPGADFKVTSSPWTPPNNAVTRWKEGGVYKGTTAKLSFIGGKDNVADDYTKPDIGGSLKSEFYADYADLLADYALGFEQQMGQPLEVISMQNEPDTITDYESCIWDAGSIKDFLVILGERFDLKKVPSSIGVMAAEQENFKEDLIARALDDPSAASVLTHAAAHQYGAPWDSAKYGVKPLPRAIALGKRIWQTEMGQTTAGSTNVLPRTNDISNALAYARMIHHAFTDALANAWLYWWMWQVDAPDSDALVYIAKDGSFFYPKRYYAIGQYSKFIRPGWRRASCRATPAVGVYASAYTDGNVVAAVLINQGNEEKVIALSGSSVKWENVFRTSADEDMSPATDALSGGAVVLPPRSVSTVIGTLTTP